MSISELSSLDIIAFFRIRLDAYEIKVKTLRTYVEDVTTTDTRQIDFVIEDLLLMLAEDNVVITQIRLDNMLSQSLARQTSAFKEFIDSQRFVFKTLFDYYNKSY